MLKEVLREVLFSNNGKSKRVNKRNLEQDKKVCGEIEKFNKNFSETFFTTWVKSIFIKYIFLNSNDKEKLKKFETIHLYENINNTWLKELKIYKNCSSVNVIFIDLLEFTHTKNEDIIKVGICVSTEEKSSNEIIADQKTDYYEMEFVKQNVESEKMADFTSNCPCCGAPTNIATFGTCDHCKESISIYDNVWKIRNIKIDI